MKVITISFTLIFMSLAVYGQDVIPPAGDVYLKVINKRGRPVKNIIVHSLNTGTTGMTDRFGLFLFENISHDDSISVFLSRNREAIIPVSGLDSIVVMLRSAHLYSYTGSDVQNEYIDRKDKTEPNILLDVSAMLEQYRYNSLSELLQGRVAGLDISTAGAFASAGTTATIRGQRTLLGSNEPLVVLNGIALGTLADANLIVNVNDIKTVEVLKSATEWGSRGANGVIVITTQ